MQRMVSIKHYTIYMVNEEIVAAIKEYRKRYGWPTAFTYLRGLVRTRPFVRTVKPPEKNEANLHQG